MVSEMLWPANTRASKATCTTMPIATPMSSSSTAASIPAAEKIDRPVGTWISGPTKNANAKVRTIFTKVGTTASLATGAASMKPPMRNAGHHIRLTHVDTSETFRVNGCMRLTDHRRDARIQLVGEIDQHPQNPGPGDEQGEDEHQQLGDEAQRGFVDLGSRLQHADDQ